MRLVNWISGLLEGSDLLGKVIILSSIFLLSVCGLGSCLLVVIPDEGSRRAAEPTALVERAIEATPTTDLAEAEPGATATEAEPVDTATAAPVDTETPLPSDTATLPPTDTATPRPTRTPTLVPSDTATRPPTQTPLPSWTPSPLPTFTLVVLPTATQSASGEIATVTQVIDGDTIEVNLAGAIWRVRYIGIDTPESGDVCGSEATQANARLVSGQTVRMVKDQSETDRFGRLLRYVYVGGTFVNGALVSGGWARAVDYPPDTAMSGVLHGLAAQGAGIGCALVAVPLPTVPIRGPEPPAAPIGNCDPSYPTVCIPPYPPDLDCGDIPHRRFTVLPPDPHNFDGNDNDGIGCESG